MSIRGLRWSPYRIPLTGEFTTAHGRTAAREGLILWLETDAGVTGLGEAAPLAELGGGSVHDAAALLAELARRLIGIDCEDLPELLDSELTARPGGAAVACGLDTAALDALARGRGVPLARLLVDDAAGVVPVNATVATPSVDGAVAAARRAVEAGFGTVKLKVAVVGSPAAEEERVAAVRAAIGRGVRLRLDANGAWTPEEAFAALRRLVRYDLELVEQPVPAADLAGLARVRRAVDVPIAADEAATTLDAVRRIIATGAADAIVVKPMVAGGLRPARRIIEEAVDAGLRVVVTTTIDAGVGVAAALHLAATLPRPIPACGLATAGLLVTDLLARPPRVEQGTMPLPAAPGLGVGLDATLLGRFALEAPLDGEPLTPG